MSTYYKQTMQIEPAAGRDPYGWRAIRLRTSESWDEDVTASEVTIRATVQERTFLDVSITEYTGESRRAKMTSVRLQEPAVRALLVLLMEQRAPELAENLQRLLDDRSSGRASERRKALDALIKSL